MHKRPRRLRTGAAIRELVAESRLAPSDFIWPLFIHHDKGKIGIDAMPGVHRLDADSLGVCCDEALEAGLVAIAIFPSVVPKLCTSKAEEAYNDDGLVQVTVRRVKESHPELLVVTDVALDPYTSHGHDGILSEDGTIDNDRTVEVLVQQALSLARSGADIVAPSDMMDGRVGAIRQAFENEGHKDTKIMSYAAKYASSFYGPFRSAIGSGDRLKGDKKTYQMDPANIAEAVREIAIDIEEGADMVMVKPGMPYLDVVREAACRFDVPLFAYQVSGEYAMIEAAAANGWIDGDSAMLEALLGFKRAGCAGVLSYYALRAARLLKEG